jgi:hypothetical protein
MQEPCSFSSPQPHPQQQQQQQLQQQQPYGTLHIIQLTDASVEGLLQLALHKRRQLEGQAPPGCESAVSSLLQAPQDRLEGSFARLSAPDAALAVATPGDVGANDGKSSSNSSSSRSRCSSRSRSSRSSSRRSGGGGGRLESSMAACAEAPAAAQLPPPHAALAAALARRRQQQLAASHCALPHLLQRSVGVQRQEDVPWEARDFGGQPLESQRQDKLQPGVVVVTEQRQEQMEEEEAEEDEERQEQHGQQQQGQQQEGHQQQGQQYVQQEQEQQRQECDLGEQQEQEQQEQEQQVQHCKMAERPTASIRDLVSQFERHAAAAASFASGAGAGEVVSVGGAAVIAALISAKVRAAAAAADTGGRRELSTLETPGASAPCQGVGLPATPPPAALSGAGCQCSGGGFAGSDRRVSWAVDEEQSAASDGGVEAAGPGPALPLLRHKTGQGFSGGGGSSGGAAVEGGQIAAHWPHGRGSALSREC